MLYLTTTSSCVGALHDRCRRCLSLASTSRLLNVCHSPRSCTSGRTRSMPGPWCGGAGAWPGRRSCSRSALHRSAPARTPPCDPCEPGTSSTSHRTSAAGLPARAWPRSACVWRRSPAAGLRHEWCTTAERRKRSRTLRTTLHAALCSGVASHLWVVEQPQGETVVVVYEEEHADEVRQRLLQLVPARLRARHVRRVHHLRLEKGGEGCPSTVAVLPKHSRFTQTMAHRRHGS